MVNEVVNKNLFLVNAPAGSGKTTTIKKRISDILAKNSDDTILCITYTNRAADELRIEVESKNVQVQTIHSFISSFMGIYFSHEEIINLYFEVYGNEIRNRIVNTESKDNIQTSNERYIEQYGILNYETVKKNINKIKYNELSFNTLYYGGLSHDDLLSFSKLIINRYPITKKRISEKYKYVFIDEYQDTSSNVLDIFFEAIKESDTKLYLFGDKMQQIYKHYDGTFENKLRLFDDTNKLDVNYRSTLSIIKILNNIYNDPNFIQDEDKNKKKTQIENYIPRVLMCENIGQSINEESKNNPEALKLYIFNKQKFNSISAGNLFNAVNRMDKYSFGKKYGATDILTNDTKDNPDELFRLLFFIRDINKNYQLKKYGSVIQAIKGSNIFNQDIFAINKHSDKKMLNQKLSAIFNSFYKQEENSIEYLLCLLITENVVKEKQLKEILMNKDYENVIKIPMKEFKNLSDYLESPHVSTQHGVKGEGHDSVFFISEDSNNPSVKMYHLFSIWVNIPICFTEFQNFYYDYLEKCNNIQCEINMKISDLDKEIFEDKEKLLHFKIKEIYNIFRDNVYFLEIYSKDFDEYLKKPGVTKVKKCLNSNTVYGILSAYKLFYVGCSRAKKRLTVFVDKNKIKGDKLKLTEKFSDIGFEVIPC